MPKLTIEHTIKRDGGTEIPMPPSTKNPEGKTYHFAPAVEGGPHVADVDDNTHLTAFMQIPEFVMVDGDEPMAHTSASEAVASVVGASTSAAIAQTSEASAVDSATEAAGSATVAESHATEITSVQDDAGSTANLEGQAGGDGESDGVGEGTDTQTPLPPITAEDVPALTDDEAADYHEALLGRRPHGKAKRETIDAALVAHLETEASEDANEE